jgi:hypothetical protein
MAATVVTDDGLAWLAIGLLPNLRTVKAKEIHSVMHIV